MSQSTFSNKRRQSRVRREDKPQKHKYRLGECGEILAENKKCPKCSGLTLVVYEDRTLMCSDCGWDNRGARI